MIETERLELRPLAPADLPALVAMHQDPEVTRFLGGEPWPAEKTRAWLERTLTLAEKGLGHFAVLRREDGLLIGRCGLIPFTLDDAAYPARCTYGLPRPSTQGAFVVELGYTFAREHWGRGYASEAARRMRDHAFAVRAEPQIISLIDERNHPSIQVAKRLGMHHHGPARLVLPADEVLPHGADWPVLLFRLERSEWRASSRPDVREDR